MSIRTRGMIRKVGNSYVVTIPAQYVKDGNFNERDIVDLHIERRTEELPIEFARTSPHASKRNRKDNNAPTRISTPDTDAMGNRVLVVATRYNGVPCIELQDTCPVVGFEPVVGEEPRH